MLDFTIDLARRAGILLLSMLEGQRAVELKSPFELVTDADHASEELIVSAILQQFPDHAIIAEEGGGSGRESAYTWLIDPLDGTNNYAHGFPVFCVSLALLKDGALLLGVIYDPCRDELFSAERGQGARCNGRRIRVSETPTLAAALISTGFPYNYYAIDQDNNAREFNALLGRSQGIRRAGSAALDLAYVAMGRFDAHWELQLQPWDSAAGALLLSEAGGRLSDWRGGAWNPWNDRLVASNGRIHDELLQALA
ncbi:MAG: inositol monophosphatase family protein [Roseiflexaceae bacterium]